MAALVRVGLTGGIGSGKSTVAGFLADRGAAVIDADGIARSLTDTGGAAIPAVIAEFGPEFVDGTGAMDRSRMRELAYADPGARKRLEAIIHPLVGQVTERRAQAAQAAGRRSLVFDVPLLVESGRWRGKVDWVLVVDCTPEVQIERVIQRSGLERTQIEAIIASQASRGQRLAASDAVLFNAGLTLDQLALHVDQLLYRFGLSSPVASDPPEDSA